MANANAADTALTYAPRMRPAACALLWSALLLCCALPAHAGDAASDDAAAIRAELTREVAAWNRGDLDGYLTAYERAPTTIMIGSRPLRGYDAIAAMYHDKYGDKARMGQLSFSDLEVRPLGAGYALALGRWALAREAAAGGPVGGWFTVTMHKSAAGWRIVVDHTS